MKRNEEIRLLHERLDYYTMEADAEEVIKLLKQLNELEPQTDEYSSQQVHTVRLLGNRLAIM